MSDELFSGPPLDRSPIQGERHFYQVFSREQMATYTCYLPHAVISIGSSDEDAPVFADNPSRLDVLRLEFHDTDRKIGNLKVMTRDDARAVIAFANKMAPRVKGFILHCEVGISRSAGCAAGIAKLMGDDDMIFFERFCPNRLVYGLIVSEAGLADLYLPYSQ